MRQLFGYNLNELTYQDKLITVILAFNLSWQQFSTQDMQEQFNITRRSICIPNRPNDTALCATGIQCTSIHSIYKAQWFQTTCITPKSFIHKSNLSVIIFVRNLIRSSRSHIQLDSFVAALVSASFLHLEAISIQAAFAFPE